MRTFNIISEINSKAVLNLSTNKLSVYSFFICVISGSRVWLWLRVKSQKRRLYAFTVICHKLINNSIIFFFQGTLCVYTLIFEMIYFCISQMYPFMYFYMIHNIFGVKCWFVSPKGILLGLLSKKCFFFHHLLFGKIGWVGSVKERNFMGEFC